MQTVHLAWTKHPRGGWFRLHDAELGGLEGHGVYVIWHGGFPTRTVKVGHGELARELAARRDDPQVSAYSRFGALFVTWAIADASGAAGMAAHLADMLRPLIEDGDPDVHRIVASSPF